MQSPLLSNFKPSFEAQVFLKLSDEVPSFEEAFDTESLKTFYRQQRLSSFSSDIFREHAKSFDDNMFEDGTLSPDDRETQASPLVRYINKYSNPSLVDSHLAVNLSQRFFSDDGDSNSMSSPTSLFELSRDPQEICPIQSLESITPKQIFEVKKVTEMKGSLRMTMSFGNISLQEEPKPFQQRSSTIFNDFKNMDDEETIKIMRLVKAKKIFKIQRETKPKIPAKQKAAAAKSKGKAPAEAKAQPQTSNNTATTITTTQPPVQNAVPANLTANANAMLNIAQSMGPKEISQYMMQFQMMMQNRGGAPLPPHILPFNAMGQISPSQQKH